MHRLRDVALAGMAAILTWWLADLAGARWPVALTVAFVVFLVLYGVPWWFSPRLGAFADLRGDDLQPVDMRSAGWPNLRQPTLKPRRGQILISYSPNPNENRAAVTITVGPHFDDQQKVPFSESIHYPRDFPGGHLHGGRKYLALICDKDGIPLAACDFRVL